ncbi:TetR/AcrR family transcriptional regulator [Brevibacterium picturae]|uniref:TetR/AcrR family transcriptional regulator n=1 Tax=Brevibacterium picturae TaxID=260553 RepID=A0ABN2CRW5_9MICO
MGQKDALLDGAKRCLVEKGYGQTTARDIAEASGAHLGSIGYHYGSKDRLMNLAVLELSSDWGDTIARLVREANGESPLDRLTASLAAIRATLSETRDLQSASIQALAQAQFDDDLRAQFADGASEARREIAALLLGKMGDDQPASATAEAVVGSLVYALVVGLVAQFLIDPDSLPEAEQMKAAFGLLR